MDKVKHIFKTRKNYYEVCAWSKIDEKLLKAIQTNNIDRVETILTKKRVNTTKLGPNGYSCFHVACANGLSAIVQLLISSGPDVNAINARGNCGLHLAAHNGFPDVASQLLKAGADIDFKDTLDKTALHHACNKSCEDVVEVLIKNNANVNVLDQQMETPLFYSSYHGHLGICKLLVENGAEINRSDKNKATPLFLAALQKHASVCEYLLQHGADPRSVTESEMFSQISGPTAIKKLFAKMGPQTKFHSTDSQDNTTHQNLPTLNKNDMVSTSTTHSPSALRLNSSVSSQGSNLLDDITSSLQGPVFTTVDGAKKMPGVEIPSSNTEIEYFTIDETDDSEISDRDSRMSENLITKTDVGVAHASIETGKGADAKMPLGTFDSDSTMSGNFITKTNVGVAHSSIVTQKSDTELEFFNTKSADVDITPVYNDTPANTNEVYDDVLSIQPKITPDNMNEVYDDILNNQPAIPPRNMNEVYDDILNNQPAIPPRNMNEVYDDFLNNQPAIPPRNMNEVYDDILNNQPAIPPRNMNEVYDDILNNQPTVPRRDTNEVYYDILNNQPTIPPRNMNQVYEELDIKEEKTHDDSDQTEIVSEPLYACIRSVQNEEPASTVIDSLNTAPEETYSYITDDSYKDIKKMEASSELKIDKNEGFPNRKEESFGDNETVNDTEYEYIIAHKTTKNEKELSRKDLTLTPGNNELKETIQHQEDKIEKLKLEINNLKILLSEEKEKNAIQTAKCETLQNMYEATQQQKSVRTSETQKVDMNDKNQNNLELLEEIESPTKGNDLKEEEEIVVTTDSQKENQLLINNQNQCQDSETQADFVTDDKVNDLLAKNECLHFQIEQLSFQLSKVYNRFMRKDSDESIDSGQDSQLSPMQQQNDLLTLELEQLKQDYLHLQKEHQDLVHAGDILQEDYEKLLEERDKMQEILEKITNTKWVTQNEISALETKNVAQEIPETINPNFENWEQDKQNIIKKHSETDLRASQQKKPELLEDVIVEDGLRRSIQQNSCSGVLQDQSIILNHLQTLKDKNKKLLIEKENVIEDLEASFNENSELRQKLNATIESYSLLEKNYTSLLLEKQNVAVKDISGLDSNNINDNSIQLHSDQQEQVQLYPCQPDEKSIQTIGDNNIEQTPPNNSSEEEQNDKWKANQTELLKTLISQLQQQLTDSEKRYQETVRTYRLHLISAIQGHIDPDVKNGLFSIIEMRSLEEHC